MDSIDSIPIIDIGEIDEANGAKIDKLVKQIRQTYGEIGFAYLINHNIDPNLVENLFQKSYEFHCLPYETKMKIELNELHRGFIPINTSTDRNSKFAEVTKPNQSESFIMMREANEDDPAVQKGDFLAGPNQWPLEIRGFRKTLTSYFDAMTKLCQKICSVIAIALGTDPVSFAAEFEPPTTFLRLLRYPPIPPDTPNEIYGSAPHSDFGCITLLAQDKTGGLQVMNRQGNWIDSPYIKDTFIMNFGDMLQRWSNGLFVSTPHRVINKSGQERYSCPFFYEPNINAKVSPLNSCITAKNPRKFESIDYGEFLRAELQSGYDRHSKTDKA